jgi:site-specific recombinase XerD
MDEREVNLFDKLYERHLMLLKLKGMSEKTIDAYGRAVRRLRTHFNCNPDKLTTEDLQNYFGDLTESHPWSTVKINRLGLQFFWRYVLKIDWKWIDIENLQKLRQYWIYLHQKR